MLTLSIVIPVYNEEDHIDVCLAAISDQTVMPLEVIVVDNNSTDRTAAIAASYDFVRVIREPKQGIAFARDAGFNAARGDIIGRIDADTILPKNWVEEAIGYISEHPDELLTGGCYMYDMGMPRLAGWVAEYFSFRVNRLIIGSYIAWGSNLAFRRSLWDEVRHEVSHDTSIHEDIDLGLRLVKRGYHVTYRPERKVGIESRIFSDQRRSRAQHFRYLQRWPNTLYTHNMKRAWLGTVGMYIVYSLYWPLLPVHHLSRLYRQLAYEPEA